MITQPKLPVLFLLLVFCVYIECEALSMYSSSSCMVAEIQQSNSGKYWWWSPYRSQPTVMHRPWVNQYQKQWIVYLNYLKLSHNDVIEIAIPARNGNCRFLISEPGESTLSFSGEMECRPGQNGDKGVFTMSLDFMTGSQRIALGTGPASAVDNLFIGVRGRYLYVTSVDSKYMASWYINFSDYQKCPA